MPTTPASSRRTLQAVVVYTSTNKQHGNDLEPDQPRDFQTERTTPQARPATPDSPGTIAFQPTYEPPNFTLSPPNATVFRSKKRKRRSTGYGLTPSERPAKISKPSSSSKTPSSIPRRKRRHLLTASSATCATPRRRGHPPLSASSTTSGVALRPNRRRDSYYAPTPLERYLDPTEYSDSHVESDEDQPIATDDQHQDQYNEHGQYIPAWKRVGIELEPEVYTAESDLILKNRGVGQRQIKPEDEDAYVPAYISAGITPNRSTEGAEPEPLIPAHRRSWFSSVSNTQGREEEDVDHGDEEDVDHVDEEIVDQVDEEIVDQVDEEIVDQVDEEIVDQVDEEIVDQVDEEIVDQVDEDIVDQVDEEIVDQVDEDIVDQVDEEIVDQNDEGNADQFAFEDETMDGEEPANSTLDQAQLELSDSEDTATNVGKPASIATHGTRLLSTPQPVTVNTLPIQTPEGATLPPDTPCSVLSSISTVERRMAQENISADQEPTSTPDEHPSTEATPDIVESEVANQELEGLNTQLEAALAEEERRKMGDDDVIPQERFVVAEDEASPTENEGLTTEHVSGRRLRPRTNRVSYVEKPSLDSEQEDADVNVSSGSDFAEADNAASAESEYESENENENGHPDLPDTCDEDDDSPQSAEDDVPVVTKKASKASTKTKFASIGIDLSLPPLDNVYACFDTLVDMGRMEGLDQAVNRIRGHPIRIATMFSGTEAPVIASEMISKALLRQGGPLLRLHHLFSVENERFKQSYIDRNFNPDFIFKEALEFTSSNGAKATTVYGSTESIPGNVWLLIAGFVCKDLSKLNNHSKGLKTGGETSDTFNALRAYMKHRRPRVVLIENVRADKEKWDVVIESLADIQYESICVACDTKNYMLPQTRERTYMIAIDKTFFDTGAAKVVKRWKSLMQRLQRPASSTFADFLPEEEFDPYAYPRSLSTIEWNLSRLRGDEIRFNESLGGCRPLTKWSENGTVKPPDCGSQGFYHSLCPRVYEYIDIAHLQMAQDGADSLTKLQIWNVSQNIDRNNPKLGLAPCITPTAIMFACNRQTALTGTQLLVLQGIPLDKLHFTSENEKNKQDLAGNAMSTTVIGAAIVSSLICAPKAFECSDPPPASPADGEATYKVSVARLKKEMETDVVVSGDSDDLDISELLRDAKASSRLCQCEGSRGISKSTIRVCKECDHSACSRCAGNPEHQYEANINHEVRLRPADFEEKWRPRLPARLKLTEFAREVEALGLKINHPLAILLKNRNNEKSTSEMVLTLGRFLRKNAHCRIEYTSEIARLELQVEEPAQWLLFLKCPPAEAGTSLLRKALRQPIARGAINGSLLRPQWEIFSPLREKSVFSFTPSTPRTASYRSRIGLKNYKDETVPRSIQVKLVPTRAKSATTDIEGTYDLLPRCGTAMSSLYKRSANGQALYLFLDPDPVGQPEHDQFVFSCDHSRLQGQDIRRIVAGCPSSWRPWSAPTGTHDREIKFPRKGLPASLGLVSAMPPVERKIPLASAVDRCSKDCHQSVPILEVRIPNARLCPQLYQELSAYLWVLENARLFSRFADWNNHETLGEDNSCRCAPPLPQPLWSVSSSGEVSRQVDDEAITKFERDLHSRPPIFDFNSSQEHSKICLQVSFNLASLLHRAKGRLGTSHSSTAWRLVTDHVETLSEPFRKFSLLNNSSDPCFEGNLGLKRELYEAQRRSLTWMRKQEEGKILTVTEIEEAVHAELKWRAEAKAETQVTVRGGVLADLPSFGKTVTTIALIQSGLKSPSAIDPDRSSGLIATDATLIVCPAHLTRQWKDELHNFIGEKECDTVGIVVIEKPDELRKRTIKDLLKPKIIIVSSAVLMHKHYIAELATFAAMPKIQASMKDKAFEAWIDQVMAEIPDRLQALQDYGPVVFSKTTSAALEARLEQPGFQGKVPIRPRHGALYRPYSERKFNLSATKTPLKHAESKANILLTTSSITKSTSMTNWQSHKFPLLHMFEFDRIVIDEYHYLFTNDKTNFGVSAMVQRILAFKRWALSGTPALSNFSDVNQMASLLGVSLGRYVLGNGVVKPIETKRFLDQEPTITESHITRTESMSYQWHSSRHKRAQVFLDMFARQNEPSLGHIQFSEVLRPVTLSLAHKVVYLERSQQLLVSTRKRKETSLGSDEASEVRIDNASTPEEELLNLALSLNGRNNRRFGVDDLIKTRQKYVKNTKNAIIKKLQEAESQQSSIAPDDSHYTRYIRIVKSANELGDKETTTSLRKLVNKVAKPGAFVPTPRIEDEVENEEEAKKLKEKVKEILKHLTADLSLSARELARHTRSFRFIESIKGLIPALSEPSRPIERGCTKCNTTPPLSELLLSTVCGHIVCQSCLIARMNDEACVHDDCNVSMLPCDLIDPSMLVSSSRSSSRSSNSFQVSDGQKLGSMIELLQKLPSNDQVVVFAPNETSQSRIKTTLEERNISHLSIIKAARQVNDMVDEFKESGHSAKVIKVLILNLRDESASGLNLTNANHVIFIAPLLATNQYEYESAMIQAKARCRRYNQNKDVYFYHFAALQTIDVDILEHRYRRLDELGETSSLRSTAKASDQGKGEQSKIVRSDDGEMYLVPASWLADESHCKRLKIGIRGLESFASPIALPLAFGEEVEE